MRSRSTWRRLGISLLLVWVASGPTQATEDRAPRQEACWEDLRLEIDSGTERYRLEGRRLEARWTEPDTSARRTIRGGHAPGPLVTYEAVVELDREQMLRIERWLLERRPFGLPEPVETPPDPAVCLTVELCGRSRVIPFDPRVEWREDAAGLRVRHAILELQLVFLALLPSPGQGVRDPFERPLEGRSRR